MTARSPVAGPTRARALTGPAAALAGLLLLGCAHARAPIKQETAPGGRFADEIAAFEAMDRQSPPPAGTVLFVGSSSIRMWPSLEEDFLNLPVLNRGFGGSELEDVLDHVDRLVIRYRPRIIVLYEGDNDLAGGKKPERVLADLKAFVDTVRAELPRTRIAFLSIKPSLARWHLIDRIRSANELIRAYSLAEERLDYIDVFTPMLRPDGAPRSELFAEDGLHMNEQGYALWREVIAPYLE